MPQSIEDAVLDMLQQYKPDSVKAEMLYDHVKSAVGAGVTSDQVYGVLSKMTDKGTIQRSVSHGWYRLPPEGVEAKHFSEDAWQEGFDSGHSVGYADGLRDYKQYVIEKLLDATAQFDGARPLVEAVKDLLKEDLGAVSTDASS